MKILATTLALSVLGATACTNLQPTPTPDETHRIKVKDSAEPLDLAEVQNQLSKFVEIIELLNQTKLPAAGDNTTADVSAKQTDPANTVAPKLEELVTAINENLEQLDNAKDEAETVQQMLSIADQLSDNKQNIFSGLFDIIIRGAAPSN